MSTRKAIVALAAVQNPPRILHAREPAAMALQDLQGDALPPEVVKMALLEMPRVKMPLLKIPQERYRVMKRNAGRMERKKQVLDQLKVRNASEIQKKFPKRRLEDLSAEEMQKRLHKQRLEASMLRRTLFKVWGNLDMITQNRLLGKVDNLAALMRREHEFKQLYISVKKEHRHLTERLDAYEARTATGSSS